MTMWLLSIVMMVVGFGFVIFWHELGHFLAARWAGVRVEQFAVGMGHAIVSYRKGIGVRLGSTQKEFDRRVNDELQRRGNAGIITLREKYDIAESIGLGETEYRLSMLPIGGYVKPTGQDDLRPSSLAAFDDPKSYAAAPVGKRMVIISAGVIMNLILAGILFFALFRFVGFDVTRSMVGQVQSGSPAAAAGLRAGDELLELDGTTLHDFTKVLMNVALLPDDRTVDLKIRRDGVEKTIGIRARPTAENNGLLALGISPPFTLNGRTFTDAELKQIGDLPADQMIVGKGDTIVAINGEPVLPTDFAIYQRAIQQAYGQPIRLSIQDANSVTRETTIVAPFAAMFNRQPLQMLGAEPVTKIASLSPDSSAKDKLQPDDLVVSMTRGTEKPVAYPSIQQFITLAREAGAKGDALTFTLERDGSRVEVTDVRATTKLPDGAMGLGVAPTYASERPLLGAIDTGSTIAGAGVRPGSLVKAVNGMPIHNWYDLHKAFVAQGGSATPLQLEITHGEETQTLSITPTATEVAAIAQIRYANPIATFDDYKRIRETSSSLTAVGWGVTETRDLILQGYLMLKRIAYDQTVPASSVSGPVGIVNAGMTFAQRGPDWFIWFLAIISANLAVVNFLPVPILDGWHFLALLKEKITGKPLSVRVQEVAQYIGLVMILSLIVFVTYHDILRL